MTRRVYIVENHALVRQMVHAYLSRLAKIPVCGTAGSAEAALGELGAVQPTIVLIDLSLPGMSGVELIATLRARWPSVHTLVLSGHREAHHLENAFAAGAAGYVFKGDPKELRAAFEAVERGERYVSPAIRESPQARYG